MNWHDAFAGAATQGITFWIAVAAIALGLTLLVTALTVQLAQRLRRRRSRHQKHPAGAVQAPTPVPAARQAVYAAVAAPAPDGSLAELVDRLQAAGDVLEDISGSLAGSDSGEAIAESFLKAAGSEVEYVFKA